MSNIQDYMQTLVFKDIYDGNTTTVKKAISNALGLTFQEDTEYLVSDDISNTGIHINITQYNGAYHIGSIQIMNTSTNSNLDSITTLSAWIESRTDPNANGVLRYWKDDTNENCVFQISEYLHGFLFYCGYATGTNVITGEKSKYFFRCGGNSQEFGPMAYFYSNGQLYNVNMLASNVITSSVSISTLIVPIIFESHNVIFDKLFNVMMINIGDSLKSTIFNLDGHDYITSGRYTSVKAPLCIRVN